ncbi:MAG: TrbC/VirB2 family protein, partial [Pseudomonadota bacterium]
MFNTQFHTQTSPWEFSEQGKRFAILFIGFALTLASKGALADGGDELGDGLCQLVNILTGKYLFSLTVLAILGSVSALIFGAEMSEGLKKIVGI